MKARGITINDAEGVFNVQKRTWLSAYPSEKHGVTREDIEEKFSNKEERIAKGRNKIEEYGEDRSGWVVELDGEIVGFSVAHKSKSRDRIGAVYVLPEHQGRGIGKILLQKALGFLENSKEVWVEVASYNKNAINFYQKSGFRIVPGAEANHEIIEGKLLPTIEMKIVL